MKASMCEYPLSELLRLLQSMRKTLDCVEDKIEALEVPREIKDQVRAVCASLGSTILPATVKAEEIAERSNSLLATSCPASEVESSILAATIDLIETSLFQGLEGVDRLVRGLKTEKEGKEAYFLVLTHGADLLETYGQVRDLLKPVRHALLQSDRIGAVLMALKFSAHKHRDQRRKDAEASPYINHPIEMAEILACVGGITDATTLQGAILHDTLEDTQTTAEELEAEFGSEVRELVEELSDDKSLPKEDRKRLQIERAPNLSIRAKQIKIADKICNTQDITHSPPSSWSLKRRQEYLDWTERVVAGCRGCNKRLEEYYDEKLHEGRQTLAQKEWRVER